MCELLCALSLTPVELEKNRLDCHETRVRIFLFPVYCSSSLNKRLVWLASNEPSLNEVKNEVRVWFSFEPVQAPYLTSWFLSQILSSVGNWIWIDTVQRLNETTHRLLSLRSNFYSKTLVFKFKCRRSVQIFCLNATEISFRSPTIEARSFNMHYITGQSWPEWFIDTYNVKNTTTDNCSIDLRQSLFLSHINWLVF